MRKSTTLQCRPTLNLGRVLGKIFNLESHMQEVDLILKKKSHTTPVFPFLVWRPTSHCHYSQSALEFYTMLLSKMGLDTFPRMTISPYYIFPRTTSPDHIPVHISPNTRLRKNTFPRGPFPRVTFPRRPFFHVAKLMLRIFNT
jgi:hypothetical protein